MTRADLVLDRVADAVVRLAGDRPIVAVDGVDGAGKTRFADRLARCIALRGAAVLRASVDGFHQPRAIRYRRGRNDAEGYFQDSFDHAALIHELLQPFRDGARCVRTACFDHRLDREAITVHHGLEERAVLLLDGIFLHRDELRGFWDLSVFLDVPFAASFARLAARDGLDPMSSAGRRYIGGQEIYLRRCEPRSRATIVVDNTDWAAPAIVADRSLGPRPAQGAEAVGR